MRHTASSRDFDDFPRAMASESRQPLLALLGEPEVTLTGLTRYLRLNQFTISRRPALLRRVNPMGTRRARRTTVCYTGPSCVSGGREGVPAHLHGPGMRVAANAQSDPPGAINKFREDG